MPITRSMLKKSGSVGAISYHGSSKQKLAISRSFRKLDQLKEYERLQSGIDSSRDSRSPRCLKLVSASKCDHGEDNTRQFRNKLAPFWTMEKPTCGVKFSRDTNNRRKKLDIEPSNLVRWRRNY